MRNNTLRALRAYLLLSDQEKLEFFDSIREIETMDKNVRLDYKKSLLLRAPSKAVKPNF
jgi:hypothetical protein